MRMRSVAIATTMAFGLANSTGVLAASAGNSAGSVNQSRVASVAGNSAGSITYVFGVDAQPTQPGLPEESGPCPMPDAPAPQAPAKPVVTKPVVTKPKPAVTKPVVKPVVTKPAAAKASAANQIRPAAVRADASVSWAAVVATFAALVWSLR